MELRDYLNIIKKRWIVIVAITLLVIAVVLVYSFVQEPVYEARPPAWSAQHYRARANTPPTPPSR